MHESIYDRFMERAVARVKKIKLGNPLDSSTMVGAQASREQLEKILSYMKIGSDEGARVLTGGTRPILVRDLEGGYYVTPTVFEGHNQMRVFQEEIFGPVLSVTKFSTDEEALTIANDTAVWAGRGRLDARRQPRLPHGARACRPAACGPIATTCIRRMRRSAATSNRASAVKTTR